MGRFAARVTARWRAIDSLLPDPAVPDPTLADHIAGCGAALAVGSGGNLAAFGTCRHSEPDPGEIDLSWGMAGRFELTPTVIGPDAATALDRLICLWRDHLADVPGSADDDTAAIITWPSRDVEPVATLQRHGLRPLAVVAIRQSARAGGAARGPRNVPAGGVRIRRAGPDDAQTVALLGAEVVRFDAHFSGTPDRPGTVGALRREAERLLAPPAVGRDGADGGDGVDARARPWTWLAERRGLAGRPGRPVGLIAAQRPDHASWIAPMTRLAPVAYTVLGFVSPQQRSAGVGAALAARLHDEIDPAGVAATLLHYEQLNPYAAAFWSRQGYRPLWTVWEARPARSLQ
jgi:GNAT superfamily N-acetyltransferase